ncbi:MAG: winged helix-turn-helix transcriptional regulator [Solirubrobacteraceae bacterium]
MKSYGQFCAAARALDVVGDRWSLLIVRELLMRDCRWTDLRDGVPGMATNLLAERLEALAAAGVLESGADDGRYRLTERGRALRPVIVELTRWGVPLMEPGAGGDATRGRWAAFAAEVLYDGADLRDAAPLQVEIDVDGETVTVDARRSGVRGAMGPAPDPDVRVRASGEDAIRLLAGDSAALRRAEVEGDAEALGRLLASRRAGGARRRA